MTGRFIRNALCVLGILISPGMSFAVDLKKSDIVFSSRFNRPTQNDRIYQVSQHFLASYLGWHYPREDQISSLVQDFRSDGRSANCSIEVWVYELERQDMICQDLYGEPVIKPWARDAGWSVRNGDILKPTYVQSRFQLARQAIDQGCTSLQQDDPNQNYADFEFGGCFSDQADEKFRRYLSDRFDSADWDRIGVNDPSNFRYSDHLRRLGAPGWQGFGAWQHPSDLKEEYREFLSVEMVNYYRQLKDHIDNYANFSVPLSANRFHSLQFPFLTNVFNLIMTERPERRASPQEMAFEATFLRSLRQRQVSTLVSESRELNRRTMALDYAFGNWIIMPYDVYIPNRPRFSDNPSAYTDILSLVSSRPYLHNGYNLDDIYGFYNVSEVMSVTYQADADRTRIAHKQRTEFEQIDQGAQAKIGSDWYETSERSIVGFIYLEGDLRSAGLKGKPVEFIHNPDGTGVSFKRSVKHGYPQVRKISYKVNDPRFVILNISHGDQIKRIVSNARLVFSNGRSLQVASQSFVGAVYLRSSELGLVKPGDQVVAFENPGEVSYDLRDYSDDAPRIRSLQYSDIQAGRSTLRLSNMGRDIPRGTTLNFNGQEFTTQTNTSLGNFYFAENVFTKLSFQQPLTRITYPNGSSESFALDQERPNLAASGVDGLIFTFRKNRYNQKLIHSVNINGSARGAIAFDALAKFGAKPRAFRVYSGSNEPVEVPVIKRNTRWYRVDWNSEALYEILEPIF